MLNFTGDSLLPKLLKIPHNDDEAKRECEVWDELFSEVNKSHVRIFYTKGLSNLQS